jgi:hypothetical protein
MGVLGALLGNGSTRKDDILSTKKNVIVTAQKERSIYYYPNYCNFQKGDNFDSVVRGYFPETFYDLVNSATSINDPPGKNNEQTLEPEFKFRNKSTGDCFWVECKFVDKLLDGKIQWTDNEHLIRYQHFLEDHRAEQVYLVIGLGGMPHRPKALYCIPLKTPACPELSPSSIEKYRHRLDHVFRYENGSIG